MKKLRHFCRTASNEVNFIEYDNATDLIRIRYAGNRDRNERALDQTTDL